MSELRWYFGPTDDDPDPGKRWHEECGGEILAFKEGAVCDRCDAGSDHDQTGRDLEVLAVVGRMYLDALDDDPDNEMLTLPGALLVTEVRAAVERQERRTEAPGE